MRQPTVQPVPDGHRTADPRCAVNQNQGDPMSWPEAFCYITFWIALAAIFITIILKGM